MVGTQGSRVRWVHRGAGYGGYTEEQGMVGTQSSRVWWVPISAIQPYYTIIRNKIHHMMPFEMLPHIHVCLMTN